MRPAVDCFIVGDEQYLAATSLVTNNMASVKATFKGVKVNDFAVTAYDYESLSYRSSILVPLLRACTNVETDVVILVSDILIDGSGSCFYSASSGFAFINPEFADLSSIEVATWIASAIAVVLFEHRGGEKYSELLSRYAKGALDAISILTPEDSAILSGIQRGREVNCHVIITHGIRTRCHWANEVKAVLENEFGFDSSVVRYGVVDLFRFALIPSARHRFALEILNECRMIRELNPDVRVAIVVHSFSSLLVFQALRIADALRLELTIDAVITNASILPVETQWSDFFPSSSSKRSVVVEKVLNVCGDKDVWVLVADRIIIGAGAAGLFFYSLDSSRVQNIRLANCGHSGMLNSETCRNYWGPFLKGLQVRWESPSVLPAAWVEAVDSYGFTLLFVIFFVLVGMASALLVVVFLFLTDHVDFCFRLHL